MGGSGRALFRLHKNSQGTMVTGKDQGDTDIHDLSHSSGREAGRASVTSLDWASALFLCFKDIAIQASRRDEPVWVPAHETCTSCVGTETPGVM
jgi:hypothetical protein